MLPDDKYAEWRGRLRVEENNHKPDFEMKKNTLLQVNNLVIK